MTINSGGEVQIRTQNGAGLSTVNLFTTTLSILVSVSVAANGQVTSFFSSQLNSNVAPTTTQVAGPAFNVINNAIFGIGAPVGFATGALTFPINIPITAFNGVVYETRIWNFNKNAQAYQADAFSNLSGKETGLTHLWRFENDGNAAVGGV